MITLLLGGARSGKSELAEAMAVSLPAPVTYVATAQPSDDPDFMERIAVHRSRRPPGWATVEAGSDLVGELAALEGSILIDSLGTWVARVGGFAVDARSLCKGLTGHRGSVIVVSEEVGMGVHPSTEAGRSFRDALGNLNRAVASIADEVLLVVAGRALKLDKPEAKGAR